MWDFLHGEVGLAPAVARGLGFDEVDFYYHGYETRRQKALQGHRDTSYIIYKALGGTDSLTDFLSLPAVDGPRRTASATVGGETAEEFRARMAAKNKQTLAAKATP